MSHVHRWQITTKDGHEWGTCACGARREFNGEKRSKKFGTEPITPRRATPVDVKPVSERGLRGAWTV